MVVLEPVFYPPWTMDLVFYTKKAAATVTSRRFEILDQWNNLGAPVVSYYTNEDLREMATGDPRRSSSSSVRARLPVLPPAGGLHQAP